MLDGTFATAPQNFRQIYSVLAHIGNGESARFLPLVFFMLQSKSEKTYSAAFQLLNDFAVQNGAELDPEVIMTDYEKAAINAVESVFPESRTQGCFFHLCQNFYKRIQKYGLVSAYAKDKDVFMSFKMTEALAFVPPEDVPEAFQTLQKSAPAEMHRFFQ